MKKIFKLFLIFSIFVCCSGCKSTRKVYTQCKAGAGVEENYFLRYTVYMDFNRPALEEIFITSKFENKEDAYSFVKNNKLVTTESHVDIKKYDNKYVVIIRNYKKAEFKTLEEYTEKVKTLNKTEQTCVLNPD